MPDFTLQDRESLLIGRLCGARLESVRSLRQDLERRHQGVATWTLGWLALTFDDQHVTISVRGPILEKEDGPVEIFVPSLEVTSRLPEISRWPGGPAADWLSIDMAEELTRGETLCGVAA